MTKKNQIKSQVQKHIAQEHSINNRAVGQSKTTTTARRINA